MEQIFKQFKIELEKLYIFNDTKNELLKGIIKTEFENQTLKLKKIFEENSFIDSKPYKIIEYLNNNMIELYGYKTKAERFQSQVDLLLNEQKLLKEQIKVYKKLYEESLKIQKMQKEKIDKYIIDENIYKEILKESRKYIQRHFSIGIQKEFLKILEKK